MNTFAINGALRATFQANAANPVAEKALDDLVNAAPNQPGGMPYKMVEIADIKRWVKKYFGSLKQMSSPKASMAARLLLDQAPGITFSTRSQIFSLVERLNHRSAQADLGRILDKAPTLNPNVPYKNVQPEQILRWTKKHYGDRADMTPRQARQAARLLEDVAPGIAVGTRMWLFKYIEELRQVKSAPN